LTFNFSWQGLVDNYRTFAIEIERDIKAVRELLDDGRPLIL
jgi:hypothetical protein